MYSSRPGTPAANLEEIDERIAKEWLTIFQRAADETFLHVCAKEDLSSMTGTPKCGVYVKWIGGSAIAL